MWRIIRLVTKVWEFPSYIPVVKEARVIKRSHNKMKTKWHVQVDSIPISWVEEDTLALRQNSIFFQATEGDFD
ncbi:SRPBCC family protein, partial [Candidatus Omnitrophota bacterium]